MQDVSSLTVMLNSAALSSSSDTLNQSNPSIIGLIIILVVALTVLVFSLFILLDLIKMIIEEIKHWF